MTRRQRGWAVIAASLTLGLAVWALAVWAYVVRDVPQNRLSMIVPIDAGDRAIALLDTQGARDAIALVGEDGDIKWISKLPGKLTDPPNAGITASNKTATVGYRMENGTETVDTGIVALNLQDGSETWRSPMVKATLFQRAISDEDTMFWTSWDGNTSLHAMDRKTGKILWSKNIEQTSWLELGKGAIAHGTSVRPSKIRARVDGELIQTIANPMNHSGGFVSCATGNRVWTVGWAENKATGSNEVQLHQASLDFKDNPTQARTLSWKRNEPTYISWKICGLYGDTLVIHTIEHTNHHLVLVNPERSEVIGEIDLGDWAPLPAWGPGDHFGTQPPPGQTLPRFLWLPVERSLASEQRKSTGLVLIDLEEQSAVHRTVGFDSVSTVHHDGVSYVMYLKEGQRGLATFVGREFVAAIDTSTATLLPHQVRKRFVWMLRHGSDVRFSRHTFAVLTAPTLEPITVPDDMELTYISDKARKQFGVGVSTLEDVP